MSLLEEALIYLDMGWSVYPAHHVDISTGTCTCSDPNCPCAGKHPIGSWTEYQGRLPTEQEVELWFSSLECNIGMVTGLVSGIVVVDIDGEDGFENAHELNLEPTLTARTGGGGLHLYYAIYEPVRSKVRILEGIDIRGNGGYVVLPPSLHKSGRLYEWENVKALALFNPTPFEEKLVNNASSPGWTDEILQGVLQGNRSVSAARLAGRYFNLGLSLGEVWILMTNWNRRNSPPLGVVELKRTVMWVHQKHEKAENVPIRIKTVEQLFSVLKEGVG